MYTIQNLNSAARSYPAPAPRVSYNNSDEAINSRMLDAFRFANDAPPPKSGQGGCLHWGHHNDDPTPPTPPTGLKPWTVMVWSASDNSLYHFMMDDLNECENVGSTDLMNIVAQTDHHPKGGTSVRLEIQKHPEPGLQSPVKQDMGQVNMSDPKQLADFICWSKKNYPAQHYLLIISDHGGGWQGACQDSGSGGWMTTPQIEEGLKLATDATGGKLDVVGFDACLMGSTEVAAQLKDQMSYMVGSEETEGGAGWAYNRLLSSKVLGGAEAALRASMALREEFGPREMATKIVTMAEGAQNDLATMTAIDTSKLPAVVSAVDGLAGAILNTSVNSSQLSRIADETQDFYEFKDLGDFAERLHSSSDPKLAQAAKQVSAAIAGAVVAEQHSTNYPGAHGLNIELSNTAGSDYRELKLSHDTRWADAVRSLRGAGQ